LDKISPDLHAWQSKYKVMNNYVVKVKKLHRATFSMIMVWLSDGSDSLQELNNIKQQQLTLVWISYSEGLKRKLAFSDGDDKRLIKGLNNNFLTDFADNITNLKQVANLEQVQEMLKVVTAFIEECVVNKRKG